MPVAAVVGQTLTSRNRAVARIGREQEQQWAQPTLPAEDIEGGGANDDSVPMNPELFNPLRSVEEIIAIYTPVVKPDDHMEVSNTE
jgi:hypothetical protein